MEKLIQQLNKQVAQKSAFEILSFFIRKFEGTLAFGTSLGAEDQVITDMIARIDKGTKIFTLDTGRVFPETYDTLQQTNEKYGINIEVYFPNSEKVERMVNEKGINLFYESVENRRTCCQVRKIEPLQRAMTGVDAWITGIRKEQSITRTLTQIVELDAGSRRLKINPLVNWSEKDVWDYIRENGVPYNKLHDRGFPSIGCQPCTRAVETGEDVRAGRWWWETPEQKECGLHKRNGQLNQKV
jgi:phosphoadenosine phosphosulfate reductase